jgi:hypothetical protein
MGDGREHDPVDDRIRALVADAVASAPPPPTVDEVRDGGLPVAPVSTLPSAGMHERRPALSPRARTVRAVVAYAAVVLLVLAGVRAVHGRGDDRTVMPADALPVRYVPTEVPDGLELTDAETGAAPDPGPRPDVEVYERDDGTRVRIAAGPPDWAGRAAVLGATTALPGATTTTGLATSTTAAPGTTTGPPGTTTAPSSTTTPTASGSTTSTTTAPTPGVPGLPARPGIRPETVRGGPGGVEAHDPTTTTVWFEHEGRLVALDVYGLDRTGALGIVERLTADVGGGLVPAPGDAFRRVAGSEAGPAGPAGSAGSAGTEPPAIARLVYTAADHRDGGPAFVVTTVRLHRQEGGTAATLLAATAGSFGRIDRWGDRQVLVDDGLDDGATTLVSFVDPAGVLVTVLVSALGPTDDLAPYVGGLVATDERAWQRVAAE